MLLKTQTNLDETKIILVVALYKPYVLLQPRLSVLFWWLFMKDVVLSILFWWLFMKDVVCIAEVEQHDLVVCGSLTLSVNSFLA